MLSKKLSEILFKFIINRTYWEKQVRRYRVSDGQFLAPTPHFDSSPALTPGTARSEKVGALWIGLGWKQGFPASLYITIAKINLSSSSLPSPIYLKKHSFFRICNSSFSFVFNWNVSETWHTAVSQKSVPVDVSCILMVFLNMTAIQFYIWYKSLQF